ncbi:probable xylosidase/glycosyl hydrolase [Phialocephala subalpina]|uniref:Probable xylosidase/glycosyl hydrolase n=1 Tax=Phialocephala subalpina TaxID=576137 RepID=A0A1L7WUH3_9HELO|nr:probable xylosidase/glycosyl hydrolase [Phialocephala subalpina]
MKFSISALFCLLAVSPALGQTFRNPVLWNDLADNDVFRVNDTFYYSASTMHYSPGAPILQSKDLVNWEYIGHSVPTLDWGSKYDLANGTNAYVKGIWASTLRYRESNGLFYWIGCVEFSTTYIFTAPSITGPWTQSSSIDNCYYDAGMLIDDDDTMYVAHGGGTISVSQLSPDGLSEVSTQVVFTSPSDVGYIEGSRMYKYNGSYYIFNTRPADAQFVLKSTNGPFGPYVVKELLADIEGPIVGGGVPHQGSLVDTQKGDWYYMAFEDSYPGGRMPVLAPITWGSDGFPILITVNGSWGTSYEYPLPPFPVPDLNGTDLFKETKLGPQWEWNHNPDVTKFSVGNGLKLETVTVTDDIYEARNTLTHRILGPTSSGTILLDYKKMVDGDRAGLALFRDVSAWIGIVNSGSDFKVSFWNGMTLNSSTWTTSSPGSEIASVPITNGTGKIWLRAFVDVQPGQVDTGLFFYSTDGVGYTQLGSFTLNNDWEFFMGYRYAIFNFAVIELGGSVEVDSFSLDAPGLTTTG